MKKLLLSLLLVFMVVSLAACGGNSNNAGGNVDGDLPTLMTELYAGIDEENLPMLGQMEISDDETFAWIIGAQEGFVLEGVKEAYVSEPMMGSIAHSVVVVRVNEGVDVEATVADIKAKVNPRKWVCVEAETVLVESKGDIIVLVMSNNDTATRMMDNFKKLN